MEVEYLNSCNLCDSQNIAQIDNKHNIFKCNSCGYVFDNPRPTFNEILSFYSKKDHYYSWLKEEKNRNSLWQRRLKMIKKIKNSGTLLDIGAGIGQFLYFAKNYFEVDGFEISNSAIKIAKEKYGLNLKKGQIEEIDFGNKKFDIITIFHVLEHVPYPAQLIEKCYNLLKVGGVLVIAVPNEVNSYIKRPIAHLLSALQFNKFKKTGIFGLPKIELDGTISEIHLSHFTSSSLKNLLTKKNFDIIEDTLDPYYAVTGIKKIIHHLLYITFLIIKKLIDRNLYDAACIVAKRK